METTTINTVRVGSYYHVIRDAAEYLTYRDDVRHEWTFQFVSCTAAHVIEAGRLLNDAKLYGVGGVGDTLAIETARAKCLLQQMMKGWGREDDAGQPLPITPETVGTLPTEILLELGRRVVPRRASEEELASLKK